MEGVMEIVFLALFALAVLWLLSPYTDPPLRFPRKRR